MTDLDALIRELRQRSQGWKRHLYWRAADALVTLRADLDVALAREAALTEAWVRDNLCGVCPYRRAVQAENDRLRAVLASSPPAADVDVDCNVWPAAEPEASE